MASSKKYLASGELNPNYQPDRHKEKKDRHKSKADRHSSRQSKFERSYFLAWDGEGIRPETPAIEGEQFYAYMAHSRGESITRTDKGGLSTLQCFNFLLRGAVEHENAIHVIYGGSYDVNMWLKDVPPEKLALLYLGKPVDWHGYSFEYVPRKTFHLRKFGVPHFIRDRGRWLPNYVASITVWDVFGFFGCRFTKALELYNVAPDLLARIADGKEARNDFTIERLKDFIIPYCTMELDALAELMYVLRKNLATADLRVTRWDGAGACAGALMKREGIKEHLGKGELPSDIAWAAVYAYSGGRIECLQYGHYEGTVYHDDVYSAYPAEMVNLVSMSGGKWFTLSPKDWGGVTKLWLEHCLYYAEISNIALFDISWRFPDMTLYPFANRDTFGGINYPSDGRNWVYGVELVTASQCIPDLYKYVVIHDARVFVPGNGVKPFAFLPDLFDLRKQWKKEKNGAEKVIKLAINSLYGKMIQHRGYREDTREDGRDQTPPYFNIVWAGRITAGTRAKLYKAAMQQPQAIICLATDGIYSTLPLDLDTSQRLGAWEEKTHTDFTIAQSGVYWYKDSEGEDFDYYRGFDFGSLSRDWVRWSWANNQLVYSWIDEKGELQTGAKSTRFLTLGSSLVSDERFKLWRTWHTIQRELKLYATGKRDELPGTWLEAGKWQGPYDHLRSTVAQVNSNLRGHTWKNGYTRGSIEQPGAESRRYVLPWEDRFDNIIDGVPAALYAGEYSDSYA